jgi:hypothetical protein
VPFGAIIHTYTKKEREMRDDILAKLAEIGDMLAEATCDGRQLAEVDLVFDEVMGMVGQLEQAVEYYVD